MSDDGPSIGGPEGGQTASHIKRLPEWMPPVDFELTDREIAIAEIAAYKNARILRRVIVGLTIAVLIGGSGTTVGWYLVDREVMDRTVAIDNSRVSVLIENCMETNERSRNTLKKLGSLLGGKTPTARQKRSIRSTKLLIAALAPYRGDPKLKGKRALEAERIACEKYARGRLRSDAA